MVGWVRKHALLAYFVLAYVLTWGGSLLHLVLSGGKAASGISTAAQIPSSLLVLLGPALAAMVVASIERGGEGLRSLLRPLRTWRVGAGWWALVFAYPIVHHLIIVGIRWAAGGPVPRFFTNPAMPQGSILLALAAGVGVNLVRGFGEEVGWRGYALPRLQQRWSALVASLVLGVAWGFWHWHPANIQILGWSVIWHLLVVLPATVVYTWVYNNTRGSLLVAVVFHMWLDVAEYIVPLGVYETDKGGLIVNAVVNWVIAAALVALWGRNTLSESPMGRLKSLVKRSGHARRSGRTA